MIVLSVSPDPFVPGPSSITGDSTPSQGIPPNPHFPTMPATMQPATHPQHPAQEHTGTVLVVVVWYYCGVLN